MGISKEKRRRRRRVDGPNTSDPRRRRSATTLLVWSSVLVLAALAVLSFFVVTWLRSEIGRRAGPAEVAAVIQRQKISEFPSPTEEEALNLVKSAIAVREKSEVDTYFRLGRTDAAAVVSFLEGMDDQDGKITGYQWLSSMDANYLLIDGVLVNSIRGDAPRNRLALLTPDEKGVWKIDFEAFARAVEPSWEKLLANNGGQGVARVILAKDSYFNGPFGDDDMWLCYGMASPDSDKILLGYCRKDSPQARALSLIFRQQGEPKNPSNSLKRATLELQRPEGAEARQFEIKRVLAEDWVVSDRAFDAVGAADDSPGLPPVRKSP